MFRGLSAGHPTRPTRLSAGPAFLVGLSFIEPFNPKKPGRGGRKPGSSKPGTVWLIAATAGLIAAVNFNLI
jgi:hypothetical protein